jgi:hypothetical protein
LPSSKKGKRHSDRGIRYTHIAHSSTTAQETQKKEFLENRSQEKIILSVV